MGMDRRSLLLQYGQFAANKEGWYPPYAAALDGVDADLANWKPPGAAANTIWETVAHVTHFKERLLNRIEGRPDQQISSNDDTFAVAGSSEAEWQDAVARLFAAHEVLRVALDRMHDDDLDRPAPEELLIKQFQDLIVHDAYHTGQIILLRKLKGAWPARRSFL